MSAKPTPPNGSTEPAPPAGFAEVFGRDPGRPRRGLTPGRRVWTTLGSVTAVTALIALGGPVLGSVILSPSGPGDEELAASQVETVDPSPEPGTPAPEPEPEEEEEEPEEEEEEEEEEPPASAPVQVAPPVQAPPPAPEPEPEPDPEPAKSAPDPEPEKPKQAPPAQTVESAPPPEDFSRPTGRIMGLAAKCLEPRTGHNGSEVMLNACHGGVSQQWTFHRDGTLRTAGLCLGTVGNSTGPGTRVALQNCAGGNIQQWRVSPYADIVNFAADRCLDVANAETANGTPIQIVSCSGNPAQKWTVP